MTSAVSQRLITQITERDQHGKAKYGTSLDRKDLLIEDWLQHGIEEALDLAGYLEAAKREIAALRATQVDAGRYRHLRGLARVWVSDTPGRTVKESVDIEFTAEGDDLDAGIDRAIAEGLAAAVAKPA